MSENMNIENTAVKQKLTDSAAINIEELIEKQGYSVSTTVGVSMYPMLRNRQDMIVIKPFEGRLKKYDVPLYKKDGNYILHRIIKVKENEYIIRGDNCIQKEHVTDDMVIGVLTEFYRNSKKINMEGIGYKTYVRFWHYTFPIRFFYKKMCSLMRKILQVAK